MRADPVVMLRAPAASPSCRADGVEVLAQAVRGPAAALVRRYCRLGAVDPERAHRLDGGRGDGVDVLAAADAARPAKPAVAAVAASLTSGDRARCALGHATRYLRSLQVRAPTKLPLTLRDAPTVGDMLTREQMESSDGAASTTWS